MTNTTGDTDGDGFDRDGLDLSDLRRCATAVYLAAESSVADDISAKLTWAIAEIERLREENKILTVLVEENTAARFRLFERAAQAEAQAAATVAALRAFCAQNEAFQNSAYDPETEIEVTPEMIRAGALEMSLYDSSTEEIEDVVPRIYRAMVEARKENAVLTPAQAQAAAMAEVVEKANAWARNKDRNLDGYFERELFGAINALSALDGKEGL